MSRKLRNHQTSTFIWASVSIVGVPLLLAMAYDRLGPGLLAGLAGSPPTGLSVINDRFLIIIVAPSLALIMYSFFLYHAIRLWYSHPNYFIKIILVVATILASLVTLIICLWNGLMT